MEIVNLCARTVEYANRQGGQKFVFRYRILRQLKRTVIVASTDDHRDLLPHMASHLESIPFYFSRIDWNQRSFHLLVLKHEPVVPDRGWLRNFRGFLEKKIGDTD